jgi:tetratricopeptide (TPR) repeat protein
VLSQTAGYAADALPETLDRMTSLCDELADSSGLFDTLTTLCLLRANSGDLSAAGAIGEQIAKLSERLDASAVLQSCFMRGAIAFWTGDLRAAEALLAQALASPASLEEADRPYGVNPVVATRTFAALRHFIAGDLPGARTAHREALGLAERHGRPFTSAQAATLGGVLLMLDGDARGAVTLATRAVEVADEYGFPRWRGTARVVRGAAVVEMGEGPRGLAEIREGLDQLERTGLRLGNSLLQALHAGACLRLDRLDEGLAAVAAGLEHCRDTGERCFEPELWRLRGDLLSRRTRGRAAALREATQCFERACALGRSMGAHQLERRAHRHDGPVGRERRASSSELGGVGAETGALSSPGS